MDDKKTRSNYEAMLQYFEEFKDVYLPLNTEMQGKVTIRVSESLL